MNTSAIQIDPQTIESERSMMREGKMKVTDIDQWLNFLIRMNTDNKRCRSIDNFDQIKWKYGDKSLAKPKYSRHC